MKIRHNRADPPRSSSRVATWKSLSQELNARAENSRPGAWPLRDRVFWCAVLLRFPVRCVLERVEKATNRLFPESIMVGSPYQEVNHEAGLSPTLRHRSLG